MFPRDRPDEQGSRAGDNYESWPASRSVVTFAATNEQSSIIGAMRGSVLAYDDPFGPALDPSDWAAVR